MKPINIKLDETKDSDIIEFLKEKNATTFIVKEALRMYIKAYSNIGNSVAAVEPVSEEKLNKGKKFLKG